MNQPSVVIAERVRARLRGQGIEPALDADAARAVAQAEVRRFNDLALTQGGVLVDDEARCLRDVLASLGGFGALQPLLDDPEIEEIWLNGPDSIHVARHGVAQRIDLRLTAEGLRDLVERMLHSSGRRVDISQPFVDASLPDVIRCPK